MNNKQEYNWCKECGDPCDSKDSTCNSCEEEHARVLITKYEEAKYRFLKDNNRPTYK